MDIGCGAGRHSLFAEELRVDVTSLDISPGAIKVCRELGLTKAIVGSVSELENLEDLETTYKSFILFGANLGLGGSIKGTIKMLNSLEKISQPNAIIIGNYFEPLPTTEQFHLSYHQKNRDKGKSIGEMKFRIRYQNQVSDWVEFYAPTATEFNEILSETNWLLKQDLNVGRQHFVLLERE
jgi:SAM-dependent methyltransferase